MATYAELDAAASNATLLQKTRIACVIAADAIRTEAADVPGHVQRLTWAQQVYSNPAGMAAAIIWSMLAQNQAATSVAILAASDSTVQTAVNNVVNQFAGVR